MLLIMFILSLCSDGTRHAYAKIQEQKNKVFTLEYQNIKSALGMKFTFTL